jgi:hypothetical protein
MAHQLRIYRGPADDMLEDRSVEMTDKNKITVSVSDVLPLLADALASQRTWLRDFEDDEITISTDLYEVLTAYRYFRRPSA